MGKWLHRIVEWLLALVLIAVGLLGAFHEVLHRVGLEITNPDSFTLRIVGLLALALGLERFTRFAQLEKHFASVDKQFSDLQKEIDERFAVRVVEGYENVYDAAIGILRKSESLIRTLIFANRQTAPERFFEVLIEHLKQHKLVTYHVTIAVDLSSVSDDLWKTIERRTLVQRDAGVGERFQVTILNTKKPIGFDVMVVDDRHCAIALSSIPDPKIDKQVAIHFDEQVQVSKRIRAWIDNLSPQLLSLGEAHREWSKRQKKRTVSD
jgi:hypothetical protein